MQIVFDAGKLTGNEINQCYLLIRQASSVFQNDDVIFFFPQTLPPSLLIVYLYVLHFRPVLLTYYTRHKTPGTLCARSYICYGLTDRTAIRYRNPILKNGTVQPSINFFLGLMKKLKVSRCFYYTLPIRYCLDWLTYCQLMLSSFASTIIFFRNGFG